MERKDYLALVHREANALLDRSEALVRAAADDPDRSDELDRSIETHAGRILSEVDHLEDVLKWSALREPGAALWQDADRWQGVLIGAAMAALAHDIRACADRILAGELPRLRNIRVGGRSH